MEYEKEITIDKNQLDTEWLLQPKKFLEISKASVEAEDEVARAKDNLEIVEAELYAMYKAQTINSKAPSDKAVDSSVKLNNRYKLATDEYLEKLKTKKILDKAVMAFDHRKKALENLVDLHLAGYFAAPKDAKQDKQSTETGSRRQRGRLNKK